MTEPEEHARRAVPCGRGQGERAETKRGTETKRGSGVDDTSEQAPQPGKKLLPISSNKYRLAWCASFTAAAKIYTINEMDTKHRQHERGACSSEKWRQFNGYRASGGKRLMQIF